MATDTIVWLLAWAAALCAAGYAVFVVLAILWKAFRLISFHVRTVTAGIIQKASMGLALWIVWSFRWVLCQIGKGVALIFRPVIERIKPENPQEKINELVALSSTVSGARDILGLPEIFNKADLSVAYRSAAKRADPNAGGTDGMLKMVNLARDILKGHAK